MRFSLKNETKERIDVVMRKAGYHFLRTENGQMSFVRPLTHLPYPRFHVYLKQESFNLHLDQKKPIYKGSKAHSADYQGEIIEKEAERIKSFFKQ